MKRRKMHARKDSAVFKKTAKSTKAINIAPKIMRGGFRL